MKGILGFLTTRAGGAGDKEISLSDDGPSCRRGRSRVLETGITMPNRGESDGISVSELSDASKNAEFSF